MIFSKTYSENIVQENDKTRITVEAFVTGGTEVITKIEVSPTDDGTYYDITNDGFLNWVYDTAGDFNIAVRITDDSPAVFNQIVKPIKILTAAEDNLFSADEDIVPYEPELNRWIEKGRDSFLDKHRLAQIEILGELDANRIWKDDGSRYIASDIIDIQEFKELSKFTALRIIFEGISNSTDDIFHTKSLRYKSLGTSAKKRATLRLDKNGDGTIEDTEKVDTFSGELWRV